MFGAIVAQSERGRWKNKQVSMDDAKFITFKQSVRKKVKELRDSWIK